MADVRFGSEVENLARLFRHCLLDLFPNDDDPAAGRPTGIIEAHFVSGESDNAFSAFSGHLVRVGTALNKKNDCFIGLISRVGAKERQDAVRDRLIFRRRRPEPSFRCELRNVGNNLSGELSVGGQDQPAFDIAPFDTGDLGPSRVEGFK